MCGSGYTLKKIKVGRILFFFENLLGNEITDIKGSIFEDITLF